MVALPPCRCIAVIDSRSPVRYFSIGHPVRSHGSRLAQETTGVERRSDKNTHKKTIHTLRRALGREGELLLAGRVADMFLSVSFFFFFFLFFFLFPFCFKQLDNLITFMIFIGPISSIFDVSTFAISYYWSAAARKTTRCAESARVSVHGRLRLNNRFLFFISLLFFFFFFW